MRTRIQRLIAWSGLVLLAMLTVPTQRAHADVSKGVGNWQNLNYKCVSGENCTGGGSDTHLVEVAVMNASSAQF